MDAPSEIHSTPMMPPPMPPQNPPAQIKVLGILHFVIAGLGLLLLAVSLVSQEFNRSFFSFQRSAGGLQEAQVKLSETLIEVTQPINWITYTNYAILSILLVLAGIGLLKGRRSGLSWSNRFAWCSIAFKVIQLLVSALVVIPRMNTALASLESQSAEMKMFAGIMKISMVAGMVVTPVISCIYPVVVLVLLNRESVRKSLI